MTFGSTFGRTFSPTFQPKSQAATASSWWLSGGIDPANCVAAYQPKGAADMAASLVNLANPGTYNANLHTGTEPTQIPDFNTATGWTFDASNKEYLDTTYSASLLPVTVIARIVVANEATNRAIVACTGSAGGGLELRITGAEKIQALKANIANIASSSGAVTVDSSQVVAFTFGDGTYAFYINGSASGTSTSAVTFSASQTAKIGALLNSEADAFSGSMYALAVYDVALTGTQVAAVSTAMAAL